MTLALPTAAATTFVLPPLPASASSNMTALAGRYLDQFISDDDEQGWSNAAKEVAEAEPACPADLAVKVLIVTHYTNPDMVDGQPAIDLSAFDEGIGHMLLRCVNDLLVMQERQQ
ncbi:hypothetical protein KZ810_03365 [Sphingomonas sp. RHCKR47]|uniref:hypothetical protein n=1 Tax=Sphingomonas citricola TaxID=2862498 RepID=UPI001CA52A59|nr:hypothetical protein [Sphingomonas citricola]MBW6522526.1 hypothetical protein [Sphingomonas citricola]